MIQCLEKELVGGLGFSVERRHDPDLSKLLPVVVLDVGHIERDDGVDAELYRPIFRSIWIHHLK